MCLELRYSLKPTLNHGVVCFLLSKNRKKHITQIQRSWKCCLCEEEDKNVPISILDTNTTQWKSLLSGKMLVVIVFADFLPATREVLVQQGYGGKVSPPGILTSDLPHFPYHVLGKPFWLES